MATVPTLDITYSMKIEEVRFNRGEDLISVLKLSDGKVFAVLDGAGGTTGGAIAAKTISDEFMACDEPQASWSDWLRRVDRKMAARGSGGLAAAVIVEVKDTGDVIGTSVGDCEAWILGSEELVNLTGEQVRKPFVGSGLAVPCGFSGHLKGGTLVIGTDGLWKYMLRHLIVRTATIRPLEAAVAALVNGVKMRNGSLQDDVAVVLCAA
jgi:serine/threonine protein phosphatase PrpC